MSLAAILRNKWITVALCSYEVAAIFSNDKIPTITAITRKHPVAGMTLTAAMGYHFIEEIRNAKIAQA